MDKRSDQVTSEHLLYMHDNERHHGHRGDLQALDLGDQYPERLEVLHFPANRSITVRYGDMLSHSIQVPKGFTPNSSAMAEIMRDHYPDQFWQTA